MKYLIRLAVTGLALACALAVLLIVVTRADSLETIQYDELTCDELVHSYHFNISVMEDMLVYYDGCLDYNDETLDGHPHGKLTCRFILEHGLFVQGIVNDIVSVHVIKCNEE